MRGCLVLCLCLRPRSTSVSPGRCTRPSVAFGCPTSVPETIQSELEPRRWLETARGLPLWTSTWLNVRQRAIVNCHTSPYVCHGSLHPCDVVVTYVTEAFAPTGYQTALYAMIFIPIAVILPICLLVMMLVVFNRKRCVHCGCTCRAGSLPSQMYKMFTIYE